MNAWSPPGAIDATIAGVREEREVVGRSGVTLWHADWVVRGDERPLRDAVVVMEGDRVCDVGAAVDLLPRHAGIAVARRTGVLFPGLVNAHTHLELSALRGHIPAGRGFVPWMDGLAAARREVEPESDRDAVAAAVVELEACATVAVGDVSNSLASVAPLARSTTLDATVFHEVVSFDEGGDARARAAMARRRAGGLGALRPDAIVPSPHSLYGTFRPTTAELVVRARERGQRLSIHMAEHRAERDAIERGEGAFVDWLARRRVAVAPWPRAPLFDVADELGLLAPEALLVHVTDATARELDRIAASGARVVVCPRSNLAIEGRLPPVTAMRAAGVLAGLGTDSLASSPSLDVMAEARALADAFPDVPPWEWVAMATWHGASALGAHAIGRIAVGARPRLFALDTEGVACPATALLRSSPEERRALDTIARSPRGAR